MLLIILCSFRVSRCQGGRLNPLRTTPHWRSRNSSLCWTTWCLRSSHTSEWHHISAPQSLVKKTCTYPEFTFLFHESIYLPGNSLDKAGWRMTKTRRHHTSWEQQSTSMTYVPANQPVTSGLSELKTEGKPFVSLFPLPGKQPHCHWDSALWGCGHSSSSHREMGSCGWHLSLSPQLQRRAWDNLFSQPQLRLPPQKDLAQGFQAGVRRVVNVFAPSRVCCWHQLCSWPPFLLDKSIDWQATEAGLVRGEVQEPERGFEEVSSLQGRSFTPDQ